MDYIFTIYPALQPEDLKEGQFILVTEEDDFIMNEDRHYYRRELVTDKAAKQGVTVICEQLNFANDAFFPDFLALYPGIELKNTFIFSDVVTDKKVILKAMAFGPADEKGNRRFISDIPRVTVTRDDERFTIEENSYTVFDLPADEPLFVTLPQEPELTRALENDKYYIFFGEELPDLVRTRVPEIKDQDLVQIEMLNDKGQLVSRF